MKQRGLKYLQHTVILETATTAGVGVGGGGRTRNRPSLDPVDGYLVSRRSQPFFFFLGLQVATIWKKGCISTVGGGGLWEMIGRKIAALGMEIAVRYRKEGEAGGLDSEVMLAAPQTDKFTF